MYGALCGDVSVVLPVCNTWEDYVWAGFNSLVVQKTETLLKAHRSSRVMNLEEYSHDFSWSDADMLTPELIFDRLLKTNNELMSKEARDVFRKIQASLILNQFDDILKEFCWSLDRGDRASVHYIRFLSHLILVYRALDFELTEEYANKILIEYVNYLIKSKQGHLVALFTSKLPYSSQVEKYADFLRYCHSGTSQIMASEKERESILQLAYRYGLDVLAITKRVVRNILGSYQTPETINSTNLHLFDDPVNKGDDEQIGALLWLTMEQEQSLEALIQVNSLFRRFLTEGKVNAAQKLREVLAQHASYFMSIQFSDTLQQRYGENKVKNLLRECLQHYLFLDAISKWTRWQEMWSRQPHIPRCVF